MHVKRPVGGEAGVRLSIGRHNPTAHAFFGDATGDECWISEGLGKRGPILLLGIYHHSMMLRPAQVGALLPHLACFARTGQMITPEVEDYCI